MEFYISQKDWKKVIDYAQASYDQFKAEIGGFMIAKPDKDGNIIISEPEILKQEVTGGTTEMDKVEIADYYVKCAEKHGPDVRFVWWHSHANMSAFWSGTDTNTMKEYSSGDWSAFLVVNIRQEYKFRVCVWNPIEAHEDVTLNVLGAKPKKVPKAISDSVSKLCTEPRQKFLGLGNKVKNSRQTSIYDYDDRYGQWHYSYNYNKKPEVADDTLLCSTVSHIDELCALYTEGEFTFKDWLKAVKQWNAMLSEKKQTFNIVELTEGDLHMKCGYYTGYDPMKLLNLEDKDEKNIKV